MYTYDWCIHLKVYVIHIYIIICWLSLRRRFQSLWKEQNLIIFWWKYVYLSYKVFNFPSTFLKWGLSISEVTSIPKIIIFLKVFVYTSGINDHTFTKLGGKFLCQCLGGSGLTSTVLMSAWPRMRRGKGQPENTDCRFILFEIARTTFYSFFLFF